jgi:hypothetical protein
LRMPVNILQRTIFINSCAITLYGIVEPQYLTPFVLISIAPVNIWGNTACYLLVLQNIYWHSQACVIFYFAWDNIIQLFNGCGCNKLFVLRCWE